MTVCCYVLVPPTFESEVMMNTVKEGKEQKMLKAMVRSIVTFRATHRILAVPLHSFQHAYGDRGREKACILCDNFSYT